jgi:hypothetical protein
VERAGAVDGAFHDLSVSAVTQSVELEITPSAPIQDELVVAVINDAILLTTNLLADSSPD